MLYKFKSKAAGDLIMLEANGRRVLEIVGKYPSPKGIILPEQMDAAIASLQSAVELEDQQLKAAVQAALQEGKTPPKAPEVALRQRATPFIEMLKRCHQAGAEIVWGV